MELRKLQVLKNFLANDERSWMDPYTSVILEGLIKLIEWDTKILEIFPSISPEITEYYQTVSGHFCPGYFCSISENYMLEDPDKVKPFEASEDEQTRNVLSLAFLSSCTYIRDLAVLYRSNEDVRKLVDSILEVAASDAKEKRSWQNILNKTRFHTDFQIEQIRNQIIKSMSAESR